MMFDYQMGSFVEGIILFPDWTFADVPKQPVAVKEGIIIGGTTAGATIGLTGTVDNRE